MRIIKIAQRILTIENSDFIIEATNFLSSDEYINRLRQLGWSSSINSQGHARLLAPKDPQTGVAGLSNMTGQEAMVVFSTNRANWKKNWGKQVQDLRKISRDLDFVWETPFVIPRGYNPYTLRFEEVEDENVQDIPFGALSKLNIKSLEVLDDNQWKQIEDIGYSPNQIMFSDERIKDFGYSDRIKIRQKDSI